MKAMIISVGGTPEPVVASLLEHKPEFVCFYASQQSLDKIGEIKRKAKAQGHDCNDYKVICEDSDDLVHCYEKALGCISKLSEQDIAPSEVVVDYTGGTKSMTAALALATVGHGYNFSYVGGEKRTKDGLGIVVSGTEVVKKGVSPWHIFAVEEKKRISLFVSSFQYEAAITTIQQTMAKLQTQDEEIWTGILETLKGYLAWDNFDHQAALQGLSKGLKHLELCEKFGLDRPVEDFLAHAKENFHDLNEINKKTAFFTKIHPILIRDLVSNARRRYLQHEYDDAIARLYRALEMVGQIHFEKATECPTSDVDPEKLPETIREEYVNRYWDPDTEKLKLGLFAAFRVLKEINHPMGYRFYENEESFRKIISSRNDSILAHGLQSIKKSTYEKFAQKIQELFVEGSLIEFPQLNW